MSTWISGVKWRLSMSKLYKSSYRDRQVAEKYEEVRFSSLIGKLVDHLEKRALLDMLKPQAKEVKYILDLACGTGRMTEFLVSNGFRVLGADISEYMVNEARRWAIKAGVLGLIVCDAESLPFKDDAFDCVTSVRLTGHVPPQIRVAILREVRRVSRKWIIMSYYDPHSIKGILRKTSSQLRGIKGSWYPLTHKELTNEAGLANLNLVAIKPILGRIAETYMALLSKL